MELIKEHKALVFRKFVGDGEVTRNGKVMHFELNIHPGSCNPIIRCEGKYFILTWDDILKIAEENGLFKDDEGIKIE